MQHFLLVAFAFENLRIPCHFFPRTAILLGSDAHGIDNFREHPDLTLLVTCSRDATPLAIENVINAFSLLKVFVADLADKRRLL